MTKLSQDNLTPEHAKGLLVRLMFMKPPEPMVNYRACIYWLEHYAGIGTHRRSLNDDHHTSLIRFLNNSLPRFIGDDL